MMLLIAYSVCIVFSFMTVCLCLIMLGKKEGTPAMTLILLFLGTFTLIWEIVFFISKSGRLP